MKTHCDLYVAPAHNGFVIRVQGRGTSAHSPALANFVRGCFEQDSQACVAIDLLGCQYLDSTFLGCLLNLQRDGTERRFQVVADNSVRKKLLAATNLDGYLNLVPVPPKSVGKFTRIDACSVSQSELGQHIMDAHQALAQVPSEFASTFRRIASQLKDELERQDRGGDSLADTVILPTRGRS
jgi:anti-anti-sigma regulatory factor